MANAREADKVALVINEIIDQVEILETRNKQLEERIRMMRERKEDEMEYEDETNIPRTPSSLMSYSNMSSDTNSHAPSLLSRIATEPTTSEGDTLPHSPFRHGPEIRIRPMGPRDPEGISLDRQTEDVLDITDERMTLRGPIPAIWGTTVVQGRIEQHNGMRGMLSVRAYYSTRSNTAYVAATAQRAARHEEQLDEQFEALMEGPVYAVAPRSLPQTPQEAYDLIEMIHDTHTHGHFKIEAFHLLNELRSIAERVHRRFWDRSMRWIMDRSQFDFDREWSNLPSERQAILLPPRDFSDICDGTTGRKRPKNPPQNDKMMNVDHLASHLVSQRNPGTSNYTHGIAIDHLLRVERTTVFAYGLSRTLTDARASDSEARRRFTRAFALLVAIPHRYREVAYLLDPGFQPQIGPEVSIRPVILQQQDIFSLDINTVIQVLWINRIDPAWIDHCYAFGYRMMTYLYEHNVVDRGFLDMVDDERIRRLRNQGEPPVISEWAGWQWPSREDHLRVTHQLYTALAEGKADPLRSSEWYEVGEPVVLPGLEGRATNPGDLSSLTVPDLPQPPTQLYSLVIPDPVSRLTMPRVLEATIEAGAESSDDDSVLVHSSSPLRLPGQEAGSDVSMTPRSQRLLTSAARRSRSESPTPLRSRME
ncbi:hypothetical protein AGABI1DRAFT_90742 [Agaricus bisporus var. burnettii JB137-S8]|uniref:Uncharacterized protein n=1 Tax=Agaricus bisporus var. burnettii (strain JB137-S8 / ATCC MYA-4627 / FGSC 10392) TaxID=597362 RepID=K5W246_AGABU|nr:uncharacterized protein AGABI1DRAFT_90742 [Agaricus bisporus var. burnettii JB137-S8]EKM80869.1 hypothetical protein AGABI1DRAFT_90742 [Agaricus bisporus var. burnettii JB137-S8]